MQLRGKSKILIWAVVNVSVYIGVFFGLLGFASGAWSKSSGYDTSGRYLIIALLFLLGFPFLQYFISKELRNSGNLAAAIGISSSILFEIVILTIILVFIAIGFD